MAKPAVNIGVRAARAAGRVLIRLLNQTESLSIMEKERHDFVTEADRAAEVAIIDEIRKVHPNHAFLSEEAGEIGRGDHRWIIDPLDGTRNFIHGFPHFAVSIALEIQGRIEHGIVYDPIRDELFTASRGGGAFLNDRRIRCGDRKALTGAVLATGFPFKVPRHVPPYMKMFRSLMEDAADIRRAGSAALDLAYVASGRVDGFWELGLQIWDIAAGGLLVEEAGGVVTDIAGGQRQLETGHVIAGNLKLTAQVQHRVKPHLGDIQA
ncbi:MAG: inositol monophosphatase family protein [Pseudomonadota bacterium]